MKTTGPIEICIEMAPNALAIDLARLTITEEVRERLLLLCTVMGAHGLHSISFDDVPLRWYRGGELQATKHYGNCVLTGVAASQDLSLHVEATFPGAPNALGVFSDSKTVNGAWSFGRPAALHQGSMNELADESGEIHADWYAPVGDDIACTSSSWPNPFSIWDTSCESDVPSCSLLPSTYETRHRSAVADAVLTQLLKVAVESRLDPNSRFVLYTLAAALIICPDQVQLTEDISNIPPFLRAPELHNVSEEPLAESAFVDEGRKRLCGTCDFEFSKPQLTVCLRYQSLGGRLVLHGDSADQWHSTHSSGSLARWYTDHDNNIIAWEAIQEFLPRHPNDKARLKILAFGLDALKRKLNDLETPWKEDLRAWLESEDGCFGSQARDEEAQRAFETC
jgi:hypothetical protein